MTDDIDNITEFLKNLPKYHRDIAIRFIAANFVYKRTGKGGNELIKCAEAWNEARKSLACGILDIKKICPSITGRPPMDSKLIEAYQKAQRHRCNAKS